MMIITTTTNDSVVASQLNYSRRPSQIMAEMTIVS